MGKAPQTSRNGDHTLTGSAGARSEAGEASAEGLRVPSSFDGYFIVRLLGRGGMGEVYLAQDTVLERPVAIKFIGALAPGVVARERFLREARAIARLQHPNVVMVHKAGEVEGLPY